MTAERCDLRWFKSMLLLGVILTLTVIHNVVPACGPTHIVFPPGCLWGLVQPCPPSVRYRRLRLSVRPPLRPRLPAVTPASRHGNSLRSNTQTHTHTHTIIYYNREQRKWKTHFLNKELWWSDSDVGWTEISRLGCHEQRFWTGCPVTLTGVPAYDYVEWVSMSYAMSYSMSYSVSYSVSYSLSYSVSYYCLTHVLLLPY